MVNVFQMPEIRASQQQNESEMEASLILEVRTDWPSLDIIATPASQRVKKGTDVARMKERKKYAPERTRH
jgi:hypothetical protein